jgi:hypothetical protein
MNNFQFDKKYTLRIMFNDDLLKIKIPEKASVKDILSHLKSTLNLPKESCLRLYYFSHILSENQIFTENEVKKYKENLLLIQDQKFNCEDIKSHVKIKKAGLNESFSSISSKQSSYKKSPIIPVEEAIMKCTGASKKMSKPKSSIIKERRGFGHIELTSIMNLLMSRGLEGHIRQIEHEGEEQDFVEYLDDSSDSQSSYERSHYSNQFNHEINSVNENMQNNLIQVVDNSGSLPNEDQVRNLPRRIANYDMQLLGQLMEMGFPEENCRIALRLASNDLNYASNILLFAPPEIFIDNEHLGVENSVNNFNNSAPIIQSSQNNIPNNLLLAQPNIIRIQSEDINNQPHILRIGVDQYGHNSILIVI